MTHSATAEVADLVPRNAPSSLEIGFAVPERYNASAILYENLPRGRGERVALRGLAGTWTYRDLCTAAARAGNALLSLGLGRHERVLLLLDDTPAYPTFFFGTLRAGLVPVLVNTLTPPELLRFYLEDTGARAIVLDAAFAGQLTTETAEGTRLEAALVVNGEAALPRPGRVIATDRALATFPDRLEAADTHRDDMAFWMYSSGSTGRPKGIVHLHHDLPYTVASYARHILKLTPNDICLSVPKIFFAYGLGNSLSFPFFRRRIEPAVGWSAGARFHFPCNRPISTDDLLRPAHALHRAHSRTRSAQRRSGQPSPVHLGRGGALG
jgi:acyl-coenzyme A synthetase/AMP-(fatty) acid ligase